MVDRPTFGDDVVGGPVALVPTTIASTLVAARAVHPVRTAEAEATTPGLGSTLYCAHCQQIKPHIHDINLLVYIKQIIRFFQRSWNGGLFFFSSLFLIFFRKLVLKTMFFVYFV